MASDLFESDGHPRYVGMSQEEWYHYVHMEIDSLRAEVAAVNNRNKQLIEQLRRAEWELDKYARGGYN